MARMGFCMGYSKSLSLDTQLVVAAGSLFCLTCGFRGPVFPVRSSLVLMLVCVDLWMIVTEPGDGFDGWGWVNRWIEWWRFGRNLGTVQ